MQLFKILSIVCILGSQWASSVNGGLLDFLHPKPLKLGTRAKDDAHLMEMAKAAAKLTITENDVVIAVMGVTGTGKSTFIERVTAAGLQIGHGLTSCTTDIGIHGFEHETGRNVYLLDTPGFDDTNRTDSEVLKEIAYFLGASYSKNIKLAGIIYLHPITDYKMKGSAIKNLAMFQALCGDASFEHVVLATTKWDDLPSADQENRGAEREKELTESPEFWGTMLNNGSTMFRHYNNRASAMRIVNHLLSLKGHMVLDIQRQMIDQGRSLDDTAAGQTLQRELIEQSRKYEAELHRIREGLDEAIKSGNKKLMKTMKQLEHDTAAKLKQSDEEIERIRTDYAKLQAEGEARYQEAITELNEELREYKALADQKQAVLNRIEAGLKKERQERKADRQIWDTQRERDRQRVSKLEKELQARRDRLAAQAERANNIAALQGIGGLGLIAFGAITGMNPALLAAGGSMLMNGLETAASVDELEEL